MQTLTQLYDFLRETHTIRRAVTSYYLMQAHTSQHIRSLQKALDVLDDLPGEGLDTLLQAGGQKIRVRLDYERSELAKDIYFLGHNDEEFSSYLEDQHDGVRDQADAVLSSLRERPIANVITDRDGTVNNYCGRYRSSYQSVWNAVYLTRFCRTVATDPVILTSAPLFTHGLLELSAMPGASTHYAGSKGREYHSRDGENGSLPIDDAQAEALDRLNRRIDELVEESENQVFALIGSGLQHKHGQTTIARQDIHGSIPEETSRRLLERVHEIVIDVDPDGEMFGVEDTGKDIEITLTVDAGGEFTKGDGIAFLDDELGLDIASGPNLICGDTSSDVPMVERAIELGGQDRTLAVFVTTDDDLKRAVAGAAEHHVFADTPDALVVALHRLAVERSREPS